MRYSVRRILRALGRDSPFVPVAQWLFQPQPVPSCSWPPNASVRSPAYACILPPEIQCPLDPCTTEKFLDMSSDYLSLTATVAN